VAAQCHRPAGPDRTFNQGARVTLWAGVSPKDFRTLTVTRETADGNQTSSSQRVLVGTVDAAAFQAARSPIGARKIVLGARAFFLGVAYRCPINLGPCASATATPRVATTATAPTATSPS